MAKFGETPVGGEGTPEDKEYLKELSDKEQAERVAMTKEAMGEISPEKEGIKEEEKPKIELTEEQIAIIEKHVQAVLPSWRERQGEKVTKEEKTGDEEKAKSKEDFINLKQEKTFETMGVKDDYKEIYYNIFVKDLPDEIAVKTAENVKSGKNPLIGLSEKEVDAYNKTVKTAREKAAEETLTKLEKEGRKQEYTDEVNRVSTKINEIGMEKIKEKLAEKPKEQPEKGKPVELTKDQKEIIEPVEKSIDRQVEVINQQVENLPEEKKKSFEKLRKFLGDKHWQYLIVATICAGGVAFPTSIPFSLSALTTALGVGKVAIFTPALGGVAAAQAGWLGANIAFTLAGVREAISYRSRRKKEEKEQKKSTIFSEDEPEKIEKDITGEHKEGEKEPVIKTELPKETPVRAESKQEPLEEKEIPEALKAEIPNIEDQMARIKKEIEEGEKEEEMPGVSYAGQDLGKEKELEESEKKQAKPEETKPEGTEIKEKQKAVETTPETKEETPLEKLERERDELKSEYTNLTSKSFLHPEKKEYLSEFSKVKDKLERVEKEIEKTKLESEKEEERAKLKNEKEELLKRKEELTNKLYINPVGTPKHEEFQKQYSKATDRLQEIEKAGEEKKEPKMETKEVEKKTGIEELVKFFDDLSKAKEIDAEKKQKEFAELKRNFLKNILPSPKLKTEFLNTKNSKELAAHPEKLNLLRDHLLARIFQKIDEGNNITSSKMSEIYEGKGEEYKKDEKRLIGLLTEIGIEEKVCNKKEMDRWEKMPIDEFLTNILKVKEISRTGLNKSKFERMLSYK